MGLLRQVPGLKTAYGIFHSARLRVRGLQEPARGRPSFIVIGSHKGGTTSFFWNITRHPQILPPIKKEVHYFDRKPLPSDAWYGAHFPTTDELSNKNAITGEASPSYCIFPHVPVLVKERLEDCKFVMLLRDPVKRAYSNYQFNSRRNHIRLSFEEWIERDFRQIGDKPVTADTFRRLLTHRDVMKTTPLALLRGIYVEQIKLWHSVFPPDRLLVLDSSDYFRDPQTTLGSVATEYLRLEPFQFDYQKTRNDNVSYTKMNEDTEERLRRFFAPYNEQLFDYLDKEFNWT